MRFANRRITHLARPRRLPAIACMGANPAGKRELTSRAIEPIAGQWGSTAVVAADGSIFFRTPGGGAWTKREQCSRYAGRNEPVWGARR